MKTVWITGASSGIGKALAIEYSQHDYQIIISSRNEKELQAVKLLTANPNNVSVLVYDLADIHHAEAITEKAIALYGKIDLVIHNAGISQRSLAIETNLAVDRQLMEINYFGTLALTKALLPYFVKNKKGHFAVITSLVGKFGSPYRSGYAASKHALHGYFDSLRAEHAKDNIKVTLICPGYVVTNVSINALTANGKKQETMDSATANGISAEKAASEIYKAITAQKLEAYIGKKEIYGVYLKRFFPKIFARILEKAKVT
jgi:dehydrogenase/reductase SDR family member 7B